MSKEEQKPNIYQIPKNSFDTGYVLNGQFKTRNFVEGIILALPFLGIFIYGWHDLGWDVQSTVAYCAILCAAAFLGAAHGVGGDSLFEFIQRVIRFRQSRRISKYNPRIKTELEPEYLIHDGRMLPKDKLKQMLGTVKGKVLGEENGPISSDITDEELKVFYDDDYGFLEKPDALKSKAELRAEAKQRAKEEKEYINSLPRSERKAAREEIKRKREQEEAEKKAKEAERERIINEAIKKRLDKAERVKTAQYYEKFMDPDNEQENDKPEENNAELNPQAVEFKPVTVGPSNNAVQEDVDIFDSEESIDTDEVEANVEADADTELFEDGTDTDIQVPQIDDVVFDDEAEVLDVDEDLDDLSVDIQDTQSAQPAKQGRGQVVNSDDDVSLDDVDLFDDSTVSRTEERPQNVKTSGKTMGSQKQPQTTQNNSDIDYMWFAAAFASPSDRTTFLSLIVRSEAYVSIQKWRRNPPRCCGTEYRYNPADEKGTR